MRNPQHILKDLILSSSGAKKTRNHFESRSRTKRKGRERGGRWEGIANGNAGEINQLEVDTISTVR